MNSKRSFFNRGIAKNLLHRCWPLWAAYLIFLLLILPLMLRQQLQYTVGYLGRIPVLDASVAGMGEEMIIIAFGVSILAAMAMFGYLYNNRACGMMNALPVTRTTMFFTAWLTGFVPLALCDLLAVALCLPFVAAKELSLWVLMTLLAVMLLSKLCFYGFAALCAMLTGNLIILPLVYAVLNLTAYVAELATRFVLSKVLFGLSPEPLRLSWLSPPVWMLSHYQFEVRGVGEELLLSGPGTVAIYGAVGLVFTLIAWRLYLRRQMESATDSVAVPILKPVFKYCMAYGCGVLLATFVHDALELNQQMGLAAAVITALAVLAGSLIGYFAAEMLIRKTVWVFRGHWRGWLIFAAVAVLTIGLCEADVFGWERSQPQAEQIHSVTLNGTEYSEPDSIRKILELQQSIVQNKKRHETPVSERVGTDQAVGRVRIDYVLENGSSVCREYNVYGKSGDLQDPNSDLTKLQAVLNLPEALRSRSVCKTEVKADNAVYFSAEYTRYDETFDSYDSQSVHFTPEEAVDFYENALLADLAENTIGRRFIVEDASPRVTNVTVQLEFAPGDSLASGIRPADETSWYYITIYEDNTHCIQWLKEHSDREIQVLDDGRWATCGTDLIGG